MSDKLAAALHGSSPAEQAARSGLEVGTTIRDGEGFEWELTEDGELAETAYHCVDCMKSISLADVGSYEIVGVRTNAAERAEIVELAQRTLEAADGDSNDDEIASLQAFRDEALRLLQIELPDA